LRHTIPGHVRAVSIEREQELHSDFVSILSSEKERSFSLMIL